MTSAKATASGSVIDPDKVIIFPEGIPGFEKYTRYRVFHKEENDLNVYWLECCDDKSVIFTVIDPIMYGLHYDLDLSEKEQETLQVGDPKALAIFLIISKGETADVGFNANIGGPIIINVETHLAIQKVLLQSRIVPTVIG